MKPQPWQLSLLFAVLIATALHAAAQVGDVTPESIHHQGYVEVNGKPYDGTGSFGFALVNDSGDYLWTNDGTQPSGSDPPNAFLNLPVVDGIYNVALGDSNAMTPFQDNLFFNNPGLKLRVWFDDGANGVQRLEPDQPLHATPYAKSAQTAAVSFLAIGVPDVIAVEQINYTTPRTHTLSVPPSAFVPGEAVSPFSVSAGGITTTGSTFLRAPVSLPGGAVITGFTAHVIDNDSNSEVQITLNKNEYVDNQSHVMAQVETDSVAGRDSISDTTIDKPTIDNTNAIYYVSAFDKSGDWQDSIPNDMYIGGIVITYTLSQAL